MAIVHYDNGKFKMQPVSGIHIITMCGRWIQKNFPSNDKRHTTDITKVTCKNCLRTIKEEGDKKII